MWRSYLEWPLATTILATPVLTTIVLRSKIPSGSPLGIIIVRIAGRAASRGVTLSVHAARMSYYGLGSTFNNALDYPSVEMPVRGCRNSLPVTVMETGRRSFRHLDFHAGNLNHSLQPRHLSHTGQIRGRSHTAHLSTPVGPMGTGQTQAVA